jgi:DUF4097 and DUF4098 domain-containing protein YvlB
MRRTSIVAPLLLILAGALLLARNLYPNIPLGEYFANYWPVLLILWGVLRLLEIAFWALRSRPLPPSGIGGGEWLVVLLIVLTGLSLHAVRGVSEWFPGRVRFGGVDVFGERFEYPVNAQKPCSASAHILLDDFRGDAKIMGVDGGNPEVRIAGHKTIRSLDERRAERINGDTPLEITGDSDNVVIRTRRANGNNVSATLEITAPRRANIEVRGRNGDVEVTDIAGGVTINSDNAGVRLKNIGGDVKLDLRRSDLVQMENVKGAVQIDGRGSDIELNQISGRVDIGGAYTGTLDLRDIAQPLKFSSAQTELSVSKVMGQVHLASGGATITNASGPVRLTSRSRDVQISNFSGPLEISVERGDLDIQPGQLPLARLEARSRSGDIHLALPAAAQFSITATTGAGDISNGFSGLSLETNGRRATLKGSIGSGPEITLETSRGDIVLRKATSAASATQVLKKVEQ